MRSNHYRLSVLNQIYKIYDQYIATLDIACQKGCADCCTGNVSMTTLEAMKIISFMDLDTQKIMREKLLPQMQKQRFIPTVTTNQLAEICLSGEEPPDETLDPAWGACPLLDKNICSIYESRPFGCRCMISTRQCADTGAAEVDEFILTVNHIFLQYIEHIDQNGFSGNLADVMTHTLTRASASSEIPEIHQTTLIQNSPLRILMIPPEHRKKAETILTALRAIKS